MKICFTFTDREAELVNQLVSLITIASAPIRLNMKETAPRDGFRHIYIDSPKNCPVIPDSLTKASFFGIISTQSTAL